MYLAELPEDELTHMTERPGARRIAELLRTRLWDGHRIEVCEPWASPSTPLVREPRSTPAD